LVRGLGADSPQRSLTNPRRFPMDERFYRVARIDGDYAYLERTDEKEDELLIVARALLPEEIDEGTQLRWAFLTYEIIG